MCSAPSDSITICITYHNEGNLLNRSLNSAKKAILGLEHYKILIVDDHSSMPAKDIIVNDLDSEHIEVVTNKNRMGVSRSRNLAINCATSKYIAFLDADDFYCQGFRFQNVMDDLRQLDYINCQVVILRSIVSYPEKTLANAYLGPTNNLLTNPREIILEYITEVKGKSIVTHIWDKLFNLEFLLKNNLRFDETMELFEDTRFSIEVLLKSEAVALIAREMTTHISSKMNRNYVHKTMDFLKLTEQLQPMFTYFGVSKSSFNAAHLAKTFIALSTSSWLDATKGIGNIAKSNLICEDTVNVRAIRSLYLRFLVILGVWRFPIVMALALKVYYFYHQVLRTSFSVRVSRKGKTFV